MSENIQSISQGTYTIGQTSATNFIAGPGIKIDEPSAGTVRIGNDETVLWSGVRYWWDDTSDLACSENLMNFEKVSVYAKDDWGLPETIFTFAPTANAFCTPIIGPEGDNEVIKDAKFLINENLISLNTKRYVIIGTNGGVTAGSGTCYIQFNKVVGINRISGNA